MKTVYICNINSQHQNDVLPLPSMFPDTITLHQRRTHRLTPYANTAQGKNQLDDDALPLPTMVFGLK